jgi:hypothetical protein
MESEIGSDELLSTAVVRAVSAVDGRKPRSLPPLSRVVDPDALDALFETRSDGTPRTGGRISFVYGICRVAIENGEYLTVDLLDEPPSSVFDGESGAGDPR